MTMESNIISLESFRRKPVNPNWSGLWIGPGWAVAFASTLNVPDSLAIWPGDAADLFFPELFAFRMSGEGLYVLDNYVHEHMRCEILRLCSPYGLTSTFDQMEEELGFYCLFDGPSPFKHRDDSDDEPDTLNFELLLTQEYIPPEDMLSRFPGGLVLPLNTAPTEKED